MTTAIPFVNNTEEEIPAGAVLEPDGTTDTEGRVGVRKLTTNNELAVLFNDRVPVPAGATGQARTPTPFVVVGIDDADSPIAEREQLGTRIGEWFVRKNQRGFLAIALDEQGFASVIMDPASPVLPASSGRRSGSGSGSDGDGSGSRILIGYVVSDVRCVGNIQHIYRRPQWQYEDGSVRLGDEEFWHTAGCCRCETVRLCDCDYPMTLYARFTPDTTSCIPFSPTYSFPIVYNEFMTTTVGTRAGWEGTAVNYAGCGADVTVRTWPVPGDDCENWYYEILWGESCVAGPYQYEYTGPYPGTGTTRYCPLYATSGRIDETGWTPSTGCGPVALPYGTELNVSETDF